MSVDHHPHRLYNYSAMKLSNIRGDQNSITEALQLTLPDHAVISVTGAGGKTSLVFSWARELVTLGKRVAVTTTTHMADPDLNDSLYDGVTVVYETGDADKTCRMAGEAMAHGCIAFIASADTEKPGKVMSPSGAVLERIRNSADVTLIEADGARRHPLKWPAPWEPVIPGFTDVTVCVAGLSAVGKPASETVFRYERLPDSLKRDTVDVNLLHKLISSREGGRKDARGEFRVFLNQVDEDIDRLAAAYRLQQFLSVLGIQTAWGSLMADAAAKEPASRRLSSLAIILEAAGNSTRFGSNKLLHIMDDGRPMAGCVMDAVSYAADMISAPPDQPALKFKKILVTQYEEVAALAPDFKIIINDRPDLGISHTMQLGIEAACDADAYMFCVCDQPYLKPETICDLIHEYEKGNAGIVSLSWQGNMRNPKIFSSKYKDELMSLSGDTGGRQIIASHMDDISLVEAESEIETEDIDKVPGSEV